jgi:MscS family membrane protein
MIIFDRPFKIGDQVLAGNMEGTVEEVGFRSTKIRTPAKTLISVPNSIIANMPLDNVSRMPRRRIKLTLGLTYATTSGQLREVVSRLRTLLGNHPQVDPETVQVNFTDFGTSSLDIVITCFTIPTALGEHLDAREEVCLQIMDTIEGLGLKFAYPSRTVYLHPAGDEQPVGATPTP